MMTRMSPKPAGLVALALALAFGATLARAADDETAADPHAHHRQMMAERQLQRSTVRYDVPDLKLVRDDGHSVDLRSELNDGRTVVLNFIYTTCTTICPVSSQIFSVLQEKLGAERGKVHLVSISIDPEQDTPEHLRTYAARFRAGPGWQHYTGTVQQSIAAQVAFGAYRGDKMSHAPLTLVRTAAGGPWTRFDGFATADDLLAEIHGSGDLAAAR